MRINNLFNIDTFLFPYAFFLPLILLFIFLIIKRNKIQSGITVPSLMTFIGFEQSWKIKLKSPIQSLLIFFIILFLTLALSRPIKINDFDNSSSKRRNLMIALDLSKSMTTKDYAIGMYRISRLEAVKKVITEFIEERKEDRIGLVVFGTTAFLQAPLTYDHELLKQIITSLTAGLAGDGTAIGDGIGLAVKRIDAIDADSKAIILVTDGVSNSGQVNPIQAAKIAEDLNIKIHSVGVGGTNEFDEATLKKISSTTKGVYFNASNVEGLKNVYNEINKLEGTSKEENRGKIFTEFTSLFSAITLIFILVYTFINYTLFFSIP